MTTQKTITTKTEIINNAVKDISRFLTDGLSEMEKHYLELVLSNVYANGEVAGMNTIRNIVWEK